MTAATAATDFGQFARLRAGARADDPAALREAARQFESLMVQQLLKASRSSDSGNDLLGGGEGDVYRDLYNQQMALQLSSGRGLGLAEMMVRQLQQGDEGKAGAPASAFAPAPTSTLDAHWGQTRRPVPALPDAAPASTAAPAPAQRVEQFIAELKPHAERAAQALGVPAQVLIAQAALETGWGRKPITHADGAPSHNYFGIKADARWKGARVSVDTHEVRNGETVAERAAFRAYGSVAEGFADYVRFVRDNPRYADALQHGGSGSRYIEGLQKVGYATDPQYAAKIQRIAGSQRLNQLAF